MNTFDGTQIHSDLALWYGEQLLQAHIIAINPLTKGPYVQVGPITLWPWHLEILP